MNNHSQQENPWSADQLSDQEADAFQQTFAQQIDDPHQYNPAPQGQHVFSPQQTNHGQQVFLLNNQHDYPIDPLLQSQAPQALDQTNEYPQGTIDPRLLSPGSQAPPPQPSSSTGYGHHPQTNGSSAYGQQPAGAPSFNSPGINSSYGRPVIGNPLWNMPGRNDFHQPIPPVEVDLLNLAPAPWPANVAGHQPGPSQPNAQHGSPFFQNDPAMQNPVDPQQQQQQHQPANQIPYQQPVAAPQASSAAPNHQAGNGMENRRGSRSLRPWSPEEVRRAQQMREDGFTDKEIAAALNRSESSVVGKLWRLEGNDPHGGYMKKRRDGDSVA